MVGRHFQVNLSQSQMIIACNCFLWITLKTHKVLLHLEQPQLRNIYINEFCLMKVEVVGTLERFSLVTNLLYEDINRD
jgi:hypothetical protein